MEKEEFVKWLKATVSDGFMRMFYYNLKNDDDEMPLEKFRELQKKEYFTKQLFLEVFAQQIEKEFD